MKKPSLRRFWWKSYRPVANWSTMTCQSPLREVAGRWSMSTRRRGNSAFAAVAEMRSAARRRRVEACNMKVSSDGGGFNVDELKKTLPRHNTSVFEQFARGEEIELRWQACGG